MTTDNVEPVAGPSCGSVMEITSQLHHYSSQQLQPAVSCLPVRVQQLTYENHDFHSNNDGDGDGGGGGGSTANDAVLAHVSPADTVANASTLPNVTDSTMV